MKKILLLFVLFGLFIQVNAQRNYTAKKLLFSQVQKPYINYGYLYNDYAAANIKNIAASGWHMPATSEYSTLKTFLSTNSGFKVKQQGTLYWNTANGLNTAKFNARGGGQRPSTFTGLKTELQLYTSTHFGSLVNNVVVTDASAEIDIVTNRFGNPNTGRSIRLIKDSTTLTDGQSGTYIGNDDKIYRTICIGTQEWLADNLAETKYRDGTDIPEVTDNTTWGNLTTGARCVYNNDESYR